jgi:CheY-like chemotaxis protein
MKISALVVDDEQPAREELCYLLSQVEAVEVIGQADNGVAALGLLDDLEPDVVFLDVQMPGLTGFEVARQVAGRPTPPHIVFVTAFDQFALDAFQVNAVDTCSILSTRPGWTRRWAAPGAGSSSRGPAWYRPRRSRKSWKRSPHVRGGGRTSS